MTELSTTVKDVTASGGSYIGRRAPCRDWGESKLTFTLVFSPQLLRTTQSVAADLIALDSPFMSEPAGPSLASTVSSIMEQDLEATWNSLESGAARGWCEASIDTILRRLQGLQRRLRVTERDRPPFEGTLGCCFAL